MTNNNIINQSVQWCWNDSIEVWSLDDKAVVEKYLDSRDDSPYWVYATNDDLTRKQRFITAQAAMVAAHAAVYKKQK
jgi:hypothetical protein